MPKMLRCTDVIPGCDFVAYGETDDEVIARAAEHARTKHHLRAITPEILAHLRSAIRDEGSRTAEGSSAA
jgi:predicted small metal-binding protein